LVLLAGQGVLGSQDLRTVQIGSLPLNLDFLPFLELEFELRAGDVSWGRPPGDRIKLVIVAL
jgi:hypothetical protein